MRLTTKIVLGGILAIFIGAIIFIVALSFTDRKSFEDSSWELDQKNIESIDVGPYQTVKFAMANQEETISVMPEGTISFRHPASEDRKGKLFMPNELKKYTTVKVVKDTLFVSIDWQKLKSHFGEGKISNIRIVNYTIYSDNVDLDNWIPTMKTEINGLHAHNIRVNSIGYVRVESCTADKLESVRGNFILKNSKLKQLSLDLDEIYNWQIENCQIDEENLSGSKTHYIKTPRSETKALNWHPKNKDARLNIELLADSARLEFK